MRKLARVLLRFLTPLVVLGAAGWTVRDLYLTRPSAGREEPAPQVPVVSVADLTPRTQPIKIQAYGTVIPAEQVTLQAQVVGRIVGQHPALVPGGVIPADSEVVRIDPTDYELRVKQQEVALNSAQAEFELEQGQQVVAAKEWALLKDQIESSQEMADYALRKPQRQVAEARVEAAKNDLAQAKLELSRTVVRAPFNALVLEEYVDLGQLVTPQSRVADLVGADRFWVQVSVPFEQLRRIHFANERGKGGSPAEVIMDTGGEEVCCSRQAHVLRLLGDLSEQGRMARVLVAIEDPLNLSAHTGETPVPEEAQPVLLKSYVRVDIEAGELKDVCEIPRAALRENDRVWVRDGEGLLHILDVDVLWRGQESVLVKNDFHPDDRLVVSRLAVVLNGMAVRVGKLPGASELPTAADAHSPDIPSTQPNPS